MLFLLFYIFSVICCYVILTVNDDQLHIAVLMAICNMLFFLYMLNTI